MRMHSIILTGFLGLPACATLMHGRVVDRLGSQEAKVALGSKEIKPGDQVALYEEKCQGGRGTRRCTTEKVGEGEVVRTLDKSYSVVKVKEGTPFGFNTIVERAAAH